MPLDTTSAQGMRRGPRRTGRETIRSAIPAVALALALAAALPVAAQERPSDALYDALQLDSLLAIMQDEGLDHGRDIATEMLGGAPAGWEDTVAAIYDPALMERAVRDSLAETLDGADVGAAVAFFTTEPGLSFIGHELAAREALRDPDVEAAARETAALAMVDDSPRLRLITDYVTVNDLIETNITAGMNGNYAFFMGLMEGGALPPDTTEDRILQDLWAQEPEIRTSTTEWLYSFLLLAYSPASDADIAAYVAFSETPAGQMVNSALFAAFDDMYGDISRALGLATARHMVTQEL